MDPVRICGSDDQRLNNAVFPDRSSQVIKFIVIEPLAGLFGIALDMTELGFAAFTENQDRLVIPMKPNRPRLGRIVEIDGGEPDYLLFAKSALDVPA